MVWTRLDFNPKEPYVPKNMQAPAGVQAMNAIGPAMKLMAVFTGKQPEDVLHAQGILGIEFDRDLKITSVLPDSPASKAGLKTGDRITRLSDASVKETKAAHDAVASIKAGDAVKVVVDREGRPVEATLTAVEGL
jgi:S1-C subfamily serine protease